jgi:hypothetical protein
MGGLDCGWEGTTLVVPKSLAFARALAPAVPWQQFILQVETTAIHPQPRASPISIEFPAPFQTISVSKFIGYEQDNCVAAAGLRYDAGNFRRNSVEYRK